MPRKHIVLDDVTVDGVIRDYLEEHWPQRPLKIDIILDQRRIAPDDLPNRIRDDISMKLLQRGVRFGKINTRWMLRYYNEEQATLDLLKYGGSVVKASSY